MSFGQRNVPTYIHTTHVSDIMGLVGRGRVAGGGEQSCRRQRRLHTTETFNIRWQILSFEIYRGINCANIYSEAIKSIQFLILNTGFWENVGDKMLIWSFLSNVYLCKTQILTVLQSLIMELWPLIENHYFTLKLALYLANDILHCIKILCSCLWVRPHRYFVIKPHQTVSNSIWISLCPKLSPFELNILGNKRFSTSTCVRCFHLKLL